MERLRQIYRSNQINVVDENDKKKKMGKARARERNGQTDRQRDKVNRNNEKQKQPMIFSTSSLIVLGETQNKLTSRCTDTQ